MEVKSRGCKVQEDADHGVIYDRYGNGTMFDVYSKNERKNLNFAGSSFSIIRAKQLLNSLK